MEADDLAEIETLTRSGFHDRDRVIEILGEEMHEPGTLDPVELAGVVDAAFARYAAERADWPAVTDCDRLDIAFIAMDQRGIIALPNAGYTQSDGYDDFLEALDEEPDRDRIVGYCFYHGQDLERAVVGAGLYLAFGPTNGRDEATKGPEIGQIIREELERVGFAVEWDGTFAQRINMPSINWQHRPTWE